MKTIQAIKCISIRTCLTLRGLFPTTNNPGSDLYLSPLRDEHTPSFKVDYLQNTRFVFIPAVRLSTNAISVAGTTMSTTI